MGSRPTLDDLKREADGSIAFSPRKHRQRHDLSPEKTPDRRRWWCIVEETVEVVRHVRYEFEATEEEAGRAFGELRRGNVPEALAGKGREEYSEQLDVLHRELIDKERFADE